MSARSTLPQVDVEFREPEDQAMVLSPLIDAESAFLREAKQSLRMCQSSGESLKCMSIRPTIRAAINGSLVVELEEWSVSAGNSRGDCILAMRR